jgi:RNA polymerase sigma factor (sigma-70 family)
MQTEATLAQSDVSELDLVKRCQAGDTEAFDELVTRYRTRVFGMIYNMVHSEQDAWDLAQESFLKAWKSIGRFRGQSSFYTWIYRIVMNVTIDWLRKKKIKGGDAEFDDAIQLREIDPASKTFRKRKRCPIKRWNVTRSAPGSKRQLVSSRRTPRSDFNEGNRRYAISRDRRSVGMFDRYRDVPAVLCAEETAKLIERRL